MRLALGDAGAHRQDRGGAVQRLDLGLLIDAQHDGALGRVEIQADDVADLVDEQRVLGQLPRLGAVRLQPERTPDPGDRGLVEPDLGGHRPRRPMPGVPRTALQRLVITSSTLASVILRGCPGRASSNRPSSPNSTNRPRHNATVLRCTPSRLATSVLLWPAAQPSTIRARCDNAADVRRRVHACNATRSSSASSIATAVGLGTTESYYCTGTNDSGH